MNESGFIESLRALANHPAARGLADDAAVLEMGGRTLVLTHDMLVEGVHYLPGDPPADVAWKLVAVNLSDLAAKGARPVGVLLGYSLGAADWDEAFVAGLGAALAAFGLPLLGGDTVRGAGARTLALTAIGESEGPVPSRAGGRPGDHLWVSGTIGDAGAGLRGLGEALVERYRNPRPRLEAGRRLAPLVAAMMDVSDGLLIDSSRLAAASGTAVEIDLVLMPLSEALLAATGDGREARLEAATAGDDYELLFAAAPHRTPDILSLQDELGLPMSRIGTLAEGSGLRLTDAGEPVPPPRSLGWVHR
ncbi:MAG TPA: thiamine-phosphate kinase [Allosphingosinicella sp.]|nr:thiamine-phosphate kinase [Allosphingosinicella sp.]